MAGGDKSTGHEETTKFPTNEPIQDNGIVHFSQDGLPDDTQNEGTSGGCRHADQTRLTSHDCMLCIEGGIETLRKMEAIHERHAIRLGDYNNSHTKYFNRRHHGQDDPRGDHHEQGHSGENDTGDRTATRINEVMFGPP